jgi:hypothetical protein
MTDLQVVKLESRNDPRKVVTTLEELLQSAKDGEIESFVAVCVRPGGTFRTRSSGYENSLELVGALHFALHDIIARE